MVKPKVAAKLDNVVFLSIALSPDKRGVAQALANSPVKAPTNRLI